jgi:hypothetical protein
VTLWSQLRPLQKSAVKFCLKQSTVALFFRQRLGKTWIALGVIEQLRPSLTLIVVPLTNKESTWADLIHSKLPDYDLLTFPDKIKRKGLLKALRGFKSGILLLHFEQMVAVIEQLRRRDWDLVVIDECHRLKDKGSRSSRAADKLSYARRKIGLSGTPIEDQPSDVWAQFRFIAPNVLGTWWADFDATYMEQPEHDPYAKDSSGRMKYRINSPGFRRAMMRYRIEKRRCKFRADKLSDFLDLIKPYSWREDLPGPAPKFHIERVVLRGDQRELYEQLRKRRVIRVGKKRITAPMKMTLNEKLAQICGGYLIDDVGSVHEVGRAKLRRLHTILDRWGSPAVIFCRYTAEVEAIKHEVGGRVAVLSGQTPRKQRPGIQRAFQAGKIDRLICQIRTGGVGVDLFRARYLVVFSCNFSSIDFSQMVARIQLPDQERPVDIILIVVNDSVDTDKLNVLRDKSSRTDRTLSSLKRSLHD